MNSSWAGLPVAASRLRIVLWLGWCLLSSGPVVQAQVQPAISVARNGSTVQLVWDAQLGTGSFVVEQSDALGAAAQWRASSLTYLSLLGAGSTVRHTAIVDGVSGTKFFRLRQLTMFSYAARTIDLQNVDFPQPHVVQLASATGLLASFPNSGSASVPGMINFLWNVNYDGVLAHFNVGVTISIDALP